MGNIHALSDAHYSTTSVDTCQRFEFWHDAVIAHCITADSRANTANSFHGELDVRSMGLLDICTMSSSEHFWSRTSKHLRSSPDDDLWLGFLQGGFGQLEQGGRNANLSANSLFLYDAGQSFKFSIGGQSNHLIRIPRHLLNSRVEGVEHCTAIVLNDSRPGVIPLREMLRQVVHSSVFLQDDERSGRCSQTILDLLALSIEIQDLGTKHAECDLYAKIMNFIRRNLADHQLSLKSLAEAHHVSTRTVTRAFARHQKSPMSVVWHERLAASRNALERGHVKSVSQVALDYGFSDFSHFSHAFRNEYGTSPQSLLRGRKVDKR
ncbi:helix-turn-helix domain-containing protein [Vreelandella olivaria]|uniref:helix-turn-helix domain-containing protein n=1 Tax=Vreelandella olivaria TaxID=390919 RepID=UPI00201EDC4C|nr:helix-turn-helix domain-containing protein [Halomonas olivaria]